MITEKKVITVPDIYPINFFDSEDTGLTEGTPDDVSPLVDEEETPDPLENFPIEVLDAEYQPIGGARFKITVDQGKEKKKKTGQNGIMMTLKPEKEITLALD